MTRSVDMVLPPPILLCGFDGSSPETIEAPKRTEIIAHRDAIPVLAEEMAAVHANCAMGRQHRRVERNSQEERAPATC
jgi:hypothetical protein